MEATGEYAQTRKPYIAEWVKLQKISDLVNGIGIAYR
jgi:hypothetical protein